MKQYAMYRYENEKKTKLLLTAVKFYSDGFYISI